MLNDGRGQVGLHRAPLDLRSCSLLEYSMIIRYLEGEWIAEMITLLGTDRSRYANG